MDDKVARETAGPPATPHHRRRWARALGWGIALLIALVLVPSLLYRGPCTLDDVARAMPGVPIFPLAQIAPHNRLGQWMMAWPLCWARWQGANRAESVSMQAPGDREFIRDWYRGEAAARHWVLCHARDNHQSHLIFQRGREALQVDIGEGDGLIAPVQLTYFAGLSDSQFRDLRGIANPIPHRHFPK